MPDLPWTAEHSLGLEDAGALARAAFGVPCNDVRVLGEGWDFINFLADDEWVLRFPKRSECDAALVRERKILERLSGQPLPVPVPRFEHFSGARADFPWHFAAYRFLEGIPLEHVDDAAVLHAVAPALGEFLSVLHDTPVEAELPSPWRNEEAAVLALRELGQARSAYPADLRQRLETHLQTTSPPEPDVPRVLAHADLLHDHILVDPATGTLTGVIDWADACTSLRSADFAGLFYIGGRALAAKAYAAYGAAPDADEWRWLEYRAITIGIGQIFYGYHESEPVLVARGLDRIRRYLP